ncbi:hypothetical protein O181_054519 [Austropuccinia psidii MF-1]|uniref:Chromo domain-containing protein n=1 Tax=Austropuccinia psidii MF-1 TaxID=1389203 RepID=A0A9Q3E4S9_9BASI|nr:hypothetical protein [Austropuccinia psidii MF-1]
MASSKFQRILNWPQPKNIKALQSFLGFANFYYSPFILNEEALSKFQILKEAFTTNPILSHFNPSLPTIVETDSSNYALGAVLSQVNDSGKHPVAFDSCKLLPAELNYGLHHKELHGIVWALRHWRAFLLSLSNSFEVLTDHSSIQYFISSKVFTCFQAHWAEFLCEFHFTITYLLGRLATLPDALYPERGVDFISKNPQNFHQVIKQDGIQESRFFSIKVEIFSDLVNKIQKEVWQDKDYKQILKKLARGETVTDYSLEPQFKLLLFKDRVVIPRNEEIQLNTLQKRHDSPLDGHPGQEKTLKLIKRDFYWAGMKHSLRTMCPYFTNVQETRTFIIRIVDRFSKMTIFILAYGTITAPELAQIFISHVFSKHGLPRDLSTAFHPETDGQTAGVNKILEQYLWMYFSYHQDDWHTWHPLAEFAYNNAGNSSKKQYPFFTIYGRNPSFDSIHIFQDSTAGKLSTKLQSVQKVVKEELESEIRRFKKYEDRNRSIPPVFQPWDKVWLASKNIKTTRPTKKLLERWLGPFEVIHTTSKPVKQSSIPNCHQLSPSPALVEEQEEWEVAQVLDSKLKRGKLWYLVEWKGFSEDPERTTWEPASSLANSPDLVKDFHSLYPDKPGPNTSRV